MKQKINNHLARLPAEIKVDGVISHAHCQELRISFPAPKERICPKCGSSYCVIKDSGRERTVRHIPSGKTGTLLTFRHRRYLCKDCHSTYYEPIYWLHPGSAVTENLFLDIFSDLNSALSIRNIALNNCVTESIVMSVMNTIRIEKPTILPETLCIDEFCGETGTYNPETKRWDIEKFHCILANGRSGAVVDILPRRDKASLVRYFKSIPLHVRQRVKFCCVDMSGSFISMARDCFPSAQICVDLFHVVKNLNEMVRDVRIRVQHELIDADPVNGKKTAQALQKMNRITLHRETISLAINKLYSRSYMNGCSCG